MGRKERITAKAIEVADNLDKGSGAHYEFEETLEYGNAWTMEWDDLIHMMDCYKHKRSGSEFGKPWGMLDRDAFVELVTRTLFEKTDKDFPPRNSDTIYVYEFEAEHEGDVYGIREELEDAGAEVVNTKADFDEETGYAFFTVNDENVGMFEDKMGKLWRFKRCGTVKRRN